jgi:hypothetical protein
LLFFVVGSPGCNGQLVGNAPESTAQTSQAISLDAGSDSATQSTDPVPCTAWAYALVANDGDAMVNAGTVIDSYQSSRGPYGGTNVGSGASVQVATTLTNNGGAIHGSVARNSPAGFPVVPVSSGAANLPLGVSSPGSLNINDAADDITLAPGDYVVADLNVNFPGAITVSPPGQVRIWVTGNLNLGGNENLGGVPSDLAFLVTSSGWVNVNGGGALYGLIYAPTSGINLDSPVFGSVIGSTVTLNSGAALHFDTSSVCNPTGGGGGGGSTLASSPPRSLPLPPKQQGCFKGTANGWTAIPCIPSSVPVARQNAPEDDITTPNGASATLPFQFGQIEATFTAFGSETLLSNSGATIGNNDFTLQGNSDFFTMANGDQGWVQFYLILSSASGGQNSIHMQQWDLTVNSTHACPGGTCVSSCGCNDTGAGNGTPQSIPTRTGGVKALDFATVAGSVYTDSNNNAVIGVVAQISWFDAGNDPLNNQGLYAIVGADQFGLAGRWKGFSGTFIGDGNSSEAEFSNTSVLTRTLAGTCDNQTIVASGQNIPWPGTCAGASALLPDTTVGVGNVTGETNNLCKVGSSAPLTASNTNLVFTQNLASTSCSPPSCISMANQVFIRSVDEDTGVRPINLNGIPFWKSPDLIFVPTGEAVTVDTVASEVLLTPGQSYDAYVRVHNDFGCSSVDGVKARLFLADPQALSTPWAAGEITGGMFATGTGQPAGGITVPAGGAALIGPFTFMAPTSGFGNGHRCALADIIAASEDAPTNLFDPLSSFQVAQRNLEFENCAYSLTNASTHDGNVQLTLSASTPGSPPAPNQVPSLAAGGLDASVTFDDPSGTWAAVWNAQTGAGTAFSISTSGTGATETTSVRLGQLSVALDAVPIGAGTSHTATASLSGLTATADLNLQAVLTDATTGAMLVTNGGTCEENPPQGPQ